MAEVLVEKIEFFSVVKDFEANSMEEAIELAKADESNDWQYVGDDEVVFFWGEN